jgi:hypothetical protein
VAPQQRLAHLAVQPVVGEVLPQVQDEGKVPHEAPEGGVGGVGVGGGGR